MRISDWSSDVCSSDLFLSRPTGEQLQAVEQAYLGWYEAQLAVINQYRQYLGAYAGLLLLTLGWLGLRLRRSYGQLERAHADLLPANEPLEDPVDTRTHALSTARHQLQDHPTQTV